MTDDERALITKGLESEDELTAALAAKLDFSIKSYDMLERDVSNQDSSFGRIFHIAKDLFDKNTALEKENRELRRQCDCAWDQEHKTVDMYNKLSQKAYKWRHELRCYQEKYNLILKGVKHERSIIHDETRDGNRIAGTSEKMRGAETGNR